ncbi:TldD/PmbA family protein [Marinicella gelatinilytica]|uniref:TldD/PmbA family protein n=1 Tax=Marinicella gelatinilytica TaxID=2996017 RepID=UPI0022608B4F|nr:metallopeptidase TldD-related protein [Marinicella gelatinilytica]MCX7545212.1 metallopeptidase TldD-related protein [Marinicella gelatinilytica]
MNQIDIVTKVLETVKHKGADDAEISYAEGRGIGVSCRQGEVDTVENNQDKSLSLTVYKNGAKGTASTAVVNDESIALTIDKALAIAALTAPDEAAGLADKELLATEFKDLHTAFDNPYDPETLIAYALRATEGARAQAAEMQADVVVDEAGVEVGDGYAIYANSNGFVGEKRGSNCSASVVAIAKKNGEMEREYWWDAVRDFGQLMNSEAMGAKATGRSVAQLGSRQVKSQQVPVLFDPSMAKSLIGHMLSAISGSALYQEASFLKDDLNKQLFPDWFNISEDPFIPGGFGSRNFDSNGIATKPRTLIDQGVLTGFMLSLYSARRLNTQPTGHGGGAHNLKVEAPTTDDLIKQMERGFLVTSLMGQGVNTVTGDYSRGASGFWIEDGAIAFPVSEMTIAGHLKDMFSHIRAVGSDIDQRSKIHTGAWLVDGMTIAGD